MIFNLQNKGSGLFALMKKYRRNGFLKFVTVVVGSAIFFWLSIYFERRKFNYLLNMKL